MNEVNPSSSHFKSNEILSRLAKLETELNNFSFEELTALEAHHLKKSFSDFKVNLDSKIYKTIDFENSETRDIDEQNKNKIDGNLKNQGIGTEESLIASVSHDLRTPLNGIIGFTDLLKETPLMPKQSELVHAITAASYHLLDVINELLEYGKLASGKQTLEMVDFNLSGVLKEVDYLCNTLILNKSVRITTVLDSDIPPILVGDPSKLSQILLNLLGNAIKFVENGDIFLNVRLDGIKEDLHWVEFKVQDTGIGISESNLQHIFNPFTQAEDNTQKKYGGYGLGLSIVRQIVENLGGAITVDSKLGVGTTFTFRLPYSKGTKKSPAKKDLLIEKIRDTQQKELVKDMPILVFEDNTMNQKLITQRLQFWGCKVHVTDNPNFGLTILKNSSVDLILMDLRMPIMDGFKLTRMIKESGIIGASEIPVIALTADFSANDKSLCQDVGICDFILKPYTPGELLTKMVKYRVQRKKYSALVRQSSKTAKVPTKPKNEVDLTSMLGECMGNIEVLEELVALFRQNVFEFIGNVKIHLKRQDYEGLVFASHKMKPGLAMMPLQSMHQKIVSIHSAAKSGAAINQIALQYQEFVEEYPMFDAAILAAVEKLKQGK